MPGMFPLRTNKANGSGKHLWLSAEFYFQDSVTDIYLMLLFSVLEHHVRGRSHSSLYKMNALASPGTTFHELMTTGQLISRESSLIIARDCLAQRDKLKFGTLVL